jgi:prephenate dehydrogenase
MDSDQAAVIGVNCISASIALRLKELKNPPSIIGYDTDAALADVARARGAFDRVARRLDRAVKDADLVIVAVPLSTLRETFAEIAPHLKPDCLVTDTAPLKAPALRWAVELLPQSTHFVGGHPIPNPAVAGTECPGGIEDASAELLRDALYCLTPPAGTPSRVIDAYSELAETLGAQPFFIDVTEHDGLQAGVEGLPSLLSVALLMATVDSPGWREMRKFAGRPFAAATGAAAAPHESLTALCLNRENVLLRLNGLLTAMVRLRGLLTEGDDEPLREIFATAGEARARWIKEWESGPWRRESTVTMDEVPTAATRFARLFFGEYGSNRLREGADRSSQK